MFLAAPSQQIAAAALVLTCGVAGLRGKKPERIAALVLAVAWIATPLVEARQSWYQPQYGIFVVDVLTLLALTWIGYFYNRYWPIYAAGYQMIAVLLHIAFLASPHRLYRAYLYANFATSYLVFGALIGGVIFEASPPRIVIQRLRRLRPLSR
jgi:hypothetical protein